MTVKKQPSLRTFLLSLAALLTLGVVTSPDIEAVSSEFAETKQQETDIAIAPDDGSSSVIADDFILEPADKKVHEPDQTDIDNDNQLSSNSAANNAESHSGTWDEYGTNENDPANNSYSYIETDSEFRDQSGSDRDNQEKQPEMLPLGFNENNPEPTVGTVSEYIKPNELNEYSTNSDAVNSHGGNASSYSETNVINEVITESKTGNADVKHNIGAGDAISGDALAMVMVLNLLHSGWSLDDILLFILDIDGDVEGDFIVDLEALAKAFDDEHESLKDGLVVNNSTKSSIHNQINLIAESGNALVEGNVLAGDAVSGDATAIASVINLINSSIASGQSFLGMINIFGDFNGDILLPYDFVNSLLESQGSNSTDQGSLSVQSGQHHTIVNDVTAIAESGNALVEGNVLAGDAVSGSAITEIVIYNLASQQVTARNALLIFVNVLGVWTGFILDAPLGTNSALLGGGSEVLTAVHTVEEVNSELHITNEISASAKTGDALVVNNTQAGHAVSGNAHSAVNLLNIFSSNLSLTDWFGVLFINVFGHWIGNVGIKPEEKEPVENDGDLPVQPPGKKVLSSTVEVFQFRPLTSAICPTAYLSAIAGIHQIGTSESITTNETASKDFYAEMNTAARGDNIGMNQGARPFGAVNNSPFESPEEERNFLPLLLILVGLLLLVIDRLTVGQKRTTKGT